LIILGRQGLVPISSAREKQAGELESRCEDDTHYPIAVQSSASFDFSDWKRETVLINIH